MRHPDMQTAISCLASLFENGELMASTDPVQFIDDAYSEITSLRARVAELEAVRNDLQSGLRTLWREYVITDSGSMSLAELIARGQRMKRFELKYGNALSSCPPLESITKAASPSEIDRLEDENAALRKAVSKLQVEVLEMKERNASLDLIAEDFLSLVVAYDQYAHPYQMALALEKARTALRRVAQTRAALAAGGGGAMSDVLERLQGYNPPDRTVDVDRQIAQDIADAASEITALRARVAEYAEKDSEIISGQIDPSVGVAWMRCSPDLPEYVRSLEVSLAEYEDGPAEQVLRGRLEAVEQERDNAVELMAHRVEDIKAAILQSAPATTCYHCGAVVEQGEEHWLVCDLHPAGQKYRALLSWSAKAEAVRVAAECRLRAWTHETYSEIESALSSCPPLGSVNACRHGEGKP